MSVSFDSLRSELKETLYEAGQCLHYWRCYNTPETVEPNIEAMNRFPWFFQIARRAFLNTALIDLCKLHERRPDSLSLHTLLRSAEGLSLAQPERLLEAEQSLKLAAPIHQKVRILRNKVFAHRNVNRDRDEWFTQAAVSPNALFELHEISKQIFNHISSAYDRSSNSFSLEGPQQFEQLLAALRNPNRAT